MTRKVEKIAGVIACTNAAGIASYLLLASRSWRIPEEDTAGVSMSSAGAAIAWANSALPILLAAIVMNSVILILSRRKQWLTAKTDAVLLSAAICWTIAVLVDFSRH